MGCDIHAYIEYTRGPDRGWETLCWAHLNPGRDYEIFGNLAGVRGGTSLIGKPKDVPDKLSFKTTMDLHRDGSDAHTRSWCTPDEWEKAISTDPEPALDYYAMLAAMRDLERRGRKVRVVFWFDN